MRRLRLLAFAPIAALAAAAACGGGDAAGPSAAAERPRIVVTYSILGSLVSELVGDAAEVEVLIPDGVDPHDWQPSARDVEAIQEADLVVANGLGLEQSLGSALDEAGRAGVPIFYASDHADLRRVGEGEEQHGDGSEDPHLWTSPVETGAVIAALATSLPGDVYVSDRATDLDARLKALDAEIERMLAVVPVERRLLVTGHESMGYFADRYGFTLVGAIVPSLSSQAEASAADLAELKEQIERTGARVIFTETGTPPQVAEAIADETGASVVELPSHALPDDGSYFTFMRELAREVAGALAPD